MTERSEKTVFWDEIDTNKAAENNEKTNKFEFQEIEDDDKHTKIEGKKKTKENNKQITQAQQQYTPLIMEIDDSVEKSHYVTEVLSDHSNDSDS